MKKLTNEQIKQYSLAYNAYSALTDKIKIDRTIYLHNPFFAYKYHSAAPLGKGYEQSIANNEIIQICKEAYISNDGKYIVFVQYKQTGSYWIKAISTQTFESEILNYSDKNWKIVLKEIINRLNNGISLESIKYSFYNGSGSVNIDYFLKQI